MPKFSTKPQAASQPQRWRHAIKSKSIAFSRGEAPLGLASQRADKLASIQAERADIHAEFERTATLGYVPADALIARLYSNHCDELAEERRLLGQLETSLASLLRRLNALFPEPSEPAPEPEPTPRARRFGPIGGHWAQSGPDTLH